nr:leucine-rich repeat domain, L domain-like protein [Tanacetum cinerariifolium]
TSLGHKLAVAAGGATSTCIDNERQALLGFKARLLDPDDLLSTWRPEDEDDCCKWSGVTCDNQTGHVTMLDLCDYDTGRVGGEISLSLLNLTYLNHLDLSFCSFHGTIPAFIGSMTHLTYLDLNDNEFFGTIPISIGSLMGLTFLNLGSNHLIGTIPMFIGNMTQLLHLDLSSNQFTGSIPMSIVSMEQSHRVCIILLPCYIDRLLIEWQGKVNEFSSTLGLLKTINLSNNNLTGKIPYEITNLLGLMLLNLSHNALLGEIPKDIGQMTELQTLDLSRNSFTGGLPSSMSKMNFLNYLDVSHNNLFGRIPTGTQLQTFELSMFIGNAGLCGPPLTKYCPGDKELEVTPVVGERKSEGEAIDELKKWFYIGGSAGYVTGFCIVFGALLINRHARHGFFQCHDSLKDWVYVKVVVFMAKWRRVTPA